MCVCIESKHLQGIIKEKQKSQLEKSTLQSTGRTLLLYEQKDHQVTSLQSKPARECGLENKIEICFNFPWFY